MNKVNVKQLLPVTPKLLTKCLVEMNMSLNNGILTLLATYTKKKKQKTNKKKNPKT